MSNLRHSHGLVSLTLTLIISSFLLALILVQSIDTVHFFDLATRKQYRAHAFFNGYNCITLSISFISQNYWYILDTPRRIPEFSCSIVSIIWNETTRTILVYGEYMGVRVYRRAEVEVSDTEVSLLFLE